MIKNYVVHCFNDLKNKTIMEAQHYCVEDFFDKLLKFQFYVSTYNNEYNVKNYELFDSTFGKYISWNTKNEQFDTVLTNVRVECFKKANQELIDSEEAEYVKTVSPKSVDSKETEWEKVDPYYVVEHLKREDIMPICRKQASSLILEKYGNSTILESLFGSGEFPHLIFKVVRIGSQNYYFYMITR